MGFRNRVCMMGFAPASQHQEVAVRQTSRSEDDPYLTIVLRSLFTQILSLSPLVVCLPKTNASRDSVLIVDGADYGLRTTDARDGPHEYLGNVPHRDS